MHRRGSVAGQVPATMGARAFGRVAALAWSLWGLCLLLLAGTCAVSDERPAAMVLSAALLGMPTVGALVASRQPANAIGWLFLGLGLLWALTLFGYFYGSEGHTPAWTFPGAIWLLWASRWAWAVAMIGTLTFPFLLFPNGRLLSPRWRVVAWLAIAAMAIPVIAGFAAETISNDPLILNPARIDAVAALGESSVVAGLAYGATFVLLFLFIAPITSLVLRLRRSHGVERQQIRWFAYIALLLTIGSLVTVLIGATYAAVVGSEAELASTVLFVVAPIISIVGLPIAVGVAILRHQLYDIDRIINRALVYGTLTTVLLGAYLVTVIGLSSVARAVAGGSSPLVTAGSTLAVAALFQPLRARIQSLVDRRFYRRKYDAARVVEQFGARLRDEVDLTLLGADLRAVAAEAVQPAHVSLWLRPTVRRSR